MRIVVYHVIFLTRLFVCLFVFLWLAVWICTSVSLLCSKLQAQSGRVQLLKAT